MGCVVVARWRVGQGKVHIAMQLIIKFILVEQTRQEVRGESYQESLQNKKKKRQEMQNRKATLKEGNNTSEEYRLEKYGEAGDRDEMNTAFVQFDLFIVD